ncbi:hypothetical protein CNO08_12305 [Lysobacter capsici]|nr:hypothetical protein CNO08_12305 [Lysobacter capsici]
MRHRPSRRRNSKGSETSRRRSHMPSTFTKKLATVAQEQHRKFSLFRENQNPLSAQIRLYWTELGLSFPGVGTAWSAVFVSWCMKQAGATKHQFGFSARHGDFIHAAIANAQAGQGVFLGRRVAQYAPKVGDLLHNNRSGNSFDFDFAATHRKYESHSAIVVEVGTDNRGRYLWTIGGNEGDSVGIKEVRLTSTGLVKNPGGLYISIVETTL